MAGRRLGLGIRGARNVTVEGTQLHAWWYDGVYIGGSPASTGITLRNVQCRKNRRTGLAIVNAAGVTVDGCVFIGTAGQDPQCGANVEPSAGERVVDVVFRACVFADNASVGLCARKGRGAIGDNYKVVSCLIEHNNGYGLVINEAVDVHVMDTCVTNNPVGVSIGGGASRLIFVGNTVKSCPRPVILAGVVDPKVIGNDMIAPEIIPVPGWPGVSGSVLILDNVAR